MALLEGHGAVVTGGASGIGRATCRRMAAEGAQVAVFDIDGAGAAKVADEIGGQSWAVDVTDPDALVGAVDAAAEAMGGLSLLFNNAGGSSLSLTHRYDPAEWERIVRLNLTGVFHGFRAAVPHLLDGGG